MLCVFLQFLNLWTTIASFENVSYDLDVIAKAYSVYNNAIAYQRDQQPDIAVHQYKLAIDIYPYFPQAHQNLAIIYDLQGQFKQAIHHHQLSYDVAKLAYGIDDVYHFQVGAISNLMVTYISSNYLDEYIKRRILSKSYDRNTATLRLKEDKNVSNNRKNEYSNDSDMQIITNNQDDEIEANDNRLEKVISILYEMQSTSTPPHPHAMFTLGQYLMAVDKKTEAVSKLQELLTFYPQHTMGLLALGNYYFKLNNFVSSSNYYATALNHLKELYNQKIASFSDIVNMISILNNLSQCHRESGQPQESLTYLYEAIRISQENQSVPPAVDTTTASATTNTTVTTPSAPVNDYMSEMLLWSTTNYYTMQGICNFWGKSIEVREHFLRQSIKQTIEIQQKQQDQQPCTSSSVVGGAVCSTDTGGVNTSFQLMKRKTTAIRALSSSSSGSRLRLPCIDPYTFSLIPYASRQEDLVACLSCCSTVPEASFRRRSKGKRDININADKEQATTGVQHNQRDVNGNSENGSKLKIGYLSFDWRDHPMVCVRV